ncbi:hypothetical protein JCM24511_00661 [Saitozyma sp. JCM 24511]|nr:hypothetical protein JCM24511_00661 [Saitozyma sp. JCM 24511]
MSDPPQTEGTNTTSTNSQQPESTKSSRRLHWPSALKFSRSKRSSEATDPEPEPESTFSKPYTAATAGPTVHAEMWDEEQAEKEAQRRAARASASAFETVFSQKELEIIYTQASRRADWDEIESKVLPKLRKAAETVGRGTWGFAKDTAGDLFKSWLEGELGLG